ncbi:hypothetical protein MY11210_000192 [Beauveria gryllotalpidicola]
MFALRSATRAIPRVSATRAFSSTVVYQKTATETVKDSIKTVDKAVSGKIVHGIDAAESAAHKVKQASKNIVGKKSAAGKAEELKGKAKGAAEDVKKSL